MASDRDWRRSPHRRKQDDSPDSRNKRRYHDERYSNRSRDQDQDRGHRKIYDREDGDTRNGGRSSRESDRNRTSRRGRSDSPISPQRRRRDSEERTYRRHHRDRPRRDERPMNRRRSSSRSVSPPPRRRPKYSRSPSPRRHKPPSSPSLRHKKRPGSPPSRSPSPKPPIRSHAPLPSQQASFTKQISPSADPPVPTKLAPNYLPSGLLARETNTVANTSIVLKYNEPPESRKPPASAPWRLYIFKGAEQLDMLEVGTRSCWLFGREKSVVDVEVANPSCSKQHAVLQFRFVEGKRKKRDGEGEEWEGEKRRGEVRPYVIDLESANGTRVNGERVPERRFVEVRSGDVLGFGESTREYVLVLPPRG